MWNCCPLNRVLSGNDWESCGAINLLLLIFLALFMYLLPLLQNKCEDYWRLNSWPALLLERLQFIVQRRFMLNILPVVSSSLASNGMVASFSTVTTRIMNKNIIIPCFSHPLLSSELHFHVTAVEIPKISSLPLPAVMPDAWCPRSHWLLWNRQMLAERFCFYLRKKIMQNCNVCL